ncbi:hypothetical protein V6N11_079404 [Hibiscus sabdariffa]|uniref:RNase H type-1 domain-containing protein n=1 Tax=Hibiscus sabdariffa TaxID=183260 RepID=A0ABR2RW41_9ROSI
MASCGGILRTDVGGWMIEVDSLDAIRLICQGQSGLCSLSLVAYIVELISCRWEVQIAHVLWEGNKLADGLAKLGFDSDLLCHRYLDPPVGVVLLFQLDTIE